MFPEGVLKVAKLAGRADAAAAPSAAMTATRSRAVNRTRPFCSESRRLATGLADLRIPRSRRIVRPTKAETGSRQQRLRPTKGERMTRTRVMLLIGAAAL